MSTLTAPATPLFALPADVSYSHAAAADSPNWLWLLFLVGIAAFACIGPACQLG